LEVLYRFKTDEENFRSNIRGSDEISTLCMYFNFASTMVSNLLSFLFRFFINLNNVPLANGISIVIKLNQVLLPISKNTQNR